VRGWRPQGQFRVARNSRANFGKLFTHTLLPLEPTAVLFVTTEGLLCRACDQPCVTVYSHAGKSRTGNSSLVSRKSTAANSRSSLYWEEYGKIWVCVFFSRRRVFFLQAHELVKLFVLCHNIPCFLVLCSHCCINLVWKMLFGCCFV